MDALLINRAFAWLKRYLPAEMSGLCAALLCAWIASDLTNSTAAAAIAATWGENLAFYGLILIRELAQHSGRGLLVIVRDLLLEFGPAEALDSLLLRPALMYAGLRLAANPALGLLAGKLAADIVFYIPTILSYELIQRQAERNAGDPAL